MESMLLGVFVGILLASIAIVAHKAQSVSRKRESRLLTLEISYQALTEVVNRLEDSLKGGAKEADLMELVEKYEAKIAAMEKPRQTVRSVSGKVYTSDELEELDPATL